jgi:hypothetical protein
MSAADFDGDEEMRDQEEAGIMLLKVALRLLGEARLRGDFSTEEALNERAVAIAAELTDGAPSPDPRRPPVEVRLIRPDRISLSSRYTEGADTHWSLMLDGTLYDGGGTAYFGRATTQRVDPETLSEEERADLERRQAEWQARIERSRQFTATSFVRTLAPPPQPGSPAPVLAVLLYEDGFWVEVTYDKEARRPSDLVGLDPEAALAVLQEDDPEVTVSDDLGTEYFESGHGGHGGGVRVSHSTYGFAPAPPPEARVLRIGTGERTVEIDLGR